MNLDKAFFSAFFTCTFSALNHVVVSSSTIIILVFSFTENQNVNLFPMMKIYSRTSSVSILSLTYIAGSVKLYHE